MKLDLQVRCVCVDTGASAGSHSHVVTCQTLSRCLGLWSRHCYLCNYGAMVDSVGSLIRLLEWKSQLCQLLSV